MRTTRQTVDTRAKRSRDGRVWITTGRRLATFGIAALAALSGTLTIATPVLAESYGATQTEIILTEAATSYGEPIRVRALITDVSDSCTTVNNCFLPFGRVDFYAVQGATQSFVASGGLSSDELTPWESDTTTEDLEICCLQLGTYTVRGYYVPGNFDPSSGDSGPVTVGKNGSTITLGGSPTTPSVGQAVTFNLHVAGYSSEPLAAKPVGFADVYEGSTNYGTAAIDANGDVTISTSLLPLGKHSLRARWAGDDHYLAAVSAPFEITVGGGTTTTSLETSTTSTTYGAPVTLTATVAPEDPPIGTPTGGVGFRSGLALIGTASLDEGSPNLAVLTTSELSVGTHIIRATYAGDGVYLASASNTVTVTVAKAATITTVTSTANPSAFGQAVTLMATVDGPGTTTVPGTVQFKDGATPIGAPQPLVLGQANLTIATLGGGSHSITAVYSGSASYNPSTSTPLVQTVTCDRLITGTVSSVTGSTGSTCLSGAKVTGSITMAAGGSLSIVNSTVNGSVTVTAPIASGATVASVGEPAAVTICGSTISGKVQITGLDGFVLVGDLLVDACRGNTIKGAVTISGTSGGLALADNRISGGVTVTSNSGDGTPGHPGLEVKANRIGGYLSCTGNDPAVTDAGRPNSVRGWIVFG